MTTIRWPLIRNEIRRNKKSNTFGYFKERVAGAHWGWDFCAPVGTACYAIADGIIAGVYGDKTDTGSFGLVVFWNLNLKKKNCTQRIVT